MKAPRAHVALAAYYLAAGALHFLRPAICEAIVPRLLPAKRELVYARGVAEPTDAAAVLHPRTRVEHAERSRRIPEPLLWLRLPLQALSILWAWRVAAKPGR